MLIGIDNQYFPYDYYYNMLKNFASGFTLCYILLFNFFAVNDYKVSAPFKNESGDNRKSALNDVSYTKSHKR